MQGELERKLRQWDQNSHTDPNKVLDQLDADIQKWRENRSREKAECAEDVSEMNQILDRIESMVQDGTITFGKYELNRRAEPMWDFWDPTDFVSDLSKEDLTHIIWGSTASRLGVQRKEIKNLAAKAIKKELYERQLARLIID